MPWRAPQEQVSGRICEQFVDVQVPQVVEQVFEAPKISSQDRNLLGTVEQIPDVLVLEMVERLVKLLKTVSVDRVQEQTVDILVTQDVEEPADFFKASSLDRTLRSRSLKLPILLSLRRSSRGLSLRRNRL